MKKPLIALFALAVVFSVQAQDVELREDHPREYIVQEGDTLWDIASRFLTRPWQWPAIWQANPQIDNPHLIFPGDRISLEFVGGQPRLTMERDDSTRRLSPSVRREDVFGPVTTIPYDAISPFLRHPRIVSEEQLEQLPYVIANEEQRVFSGPGDLAYVRGMETARVGQEVILARLTFQFEDRSRDGSANTLRRNRMTRGPAQVASFERPSSAIWRATIGSLANINYPIIGYELWEAARARVVRVGDPSTVEIIEGRREVMEGDYVLPIDYHVFEPTFFPRAMDQVPSNARVLTISEAYYGVGHYQIVAISLGQANGVEPGHVFSAFRPGETIRDNFKYPLMSLAASQNRDRRMVTLPEEFAGRLMVFRSFENISYAIVLEGRRSIRVNDRLDHPDREL